MSATVTSKRTKTRQTVVLDGRRVEYTIRVSAQAKRARVRVGPSGVEVVLPTHQRENRASEFLRQNAAWVVAQLERMDGLKRIRLPRPATKTILFRGRELAVIVDVMPSGRGTNLVEEAADRLVIRQGSSSRTPPLCTLEYWLRREARQDIEACLTLEHMHAPERKQPKERMTRKRWRGCGSPPTGPNVAGSPLHCPSMSRPWGVKLTAIKRAGSRARLRRRGFQPAFSGPACPVVPRTSTGFRLAGCRP